MADSYGRHLLRTPRHLPARRSPATQSLPLQRARAERSRDPPAPRAPRAHGAPLLDVRYTKQRAVNLHRFWPRNCSKPEHLPRAYVRIVGAMLTRQLAHWHTIINSNGRYDKLAVGSGRNHRGRLPQNENAVGTYIEELAHAQACQYAALDGWTRIARAMKISWAADGGTLLGAMCYRAMPAWDDDMDLVVPQEECRKLDRIWEEARARRLGIRNVAAAPDALWRHRMEKFRGGGGDQRPQEIHDVGAAHCTSTRLSRAWHRCHVLGPQCGFYPTRRSARAGHAGPDRSHTQKARLPSPIWPDHSPAVAHEACAPLHQIEGVGCWLSRDAATEHEGQGSA